MKTGDLAFILGVIIALVAGIAAALAGAIDPSIAGIIGIVLVILGVVVGFMNIKEKETEAFLVAAIALMVTSAVAGWLTLDLVIPRLGTLILSILGYIGVFVAPAAVIVALKSVYALAKK